MSESKTPRTDAFIKAKFSKSLDYTLFSAVREFGRQLETDLDAMDLARQLANDNTAKLTHALSGLMEAIPKMETELAASKAREERLAESLLCTLNWIEYGQPEFTQEDEWFVARETAGVALEAWRAAK